MLTRTIAVQGLRPGAHDQLDIAAELPPSVLQRLRDVDPLLRIPDRDLDRPAVGKAGLGQRGLGGVHVVGERLFVQRAEEGQRQKGLVHRVLPLEERVRHALVIGRHLERLDHLRIGQHFLFLVGREIHQAAAQLVDHLDVIDACKPCDVLGRQVARNVDVAAFQLQALGCAFLDMLDDHPLHRRFLAAVFRVQVHQHAFAGLPADHLVGTRAGGVGAQPGIAHITVGLVGHRGLHVDYAADGGGQAVQHEGQRIGLVQCQYQRLVVGRDNRLFDVVRGKAELRQDEGRRLVQQHRAAQRELGVLRGHRVARGKDMPLGHGKGDGLAVLGDLPAFGQLRLIPGVEVERVEIDEFFIDVAADVGAGEFKAFGRIEGLDVIDPVGNHQHVRRRFGKAGHGGAHGQRCCDRGRDEGLFHCHSPRFWFHSPHVRRRTRTQLPWVILASRPSSTPCD